MTINMWPLKGEPRKIQRISLERGWDKKGFAYFLEMGLGKSAVTIANFVTLLSLGKVKHLVVIVPNSLKKNWVDEIELWGVDLACYAWPQKPYFLPAKGKSTHSLDKPSMWVFNYESLLFAGGMELEKFLASNDCMVVLDESSRIKNHNAKTTKKAIALSKLAKYTRILTGTPMSQSVMDLWAQLRFIGELENFNPYAFRNRYAVLGGWMGKQVVGVKNEEELQILLNKCGIQAKKKDWWDDCPEKIFVTRHVEMNKIQKDAYMEMQREFLLELSNKMIPAPMVITQLGKLQQISRGFIYDEEGKVEELVEADKNPCVEVVKEILDETEGKVVVVGQHVYSMKLLFKSLYAYNPARIVGGMEDEELNEEKYKFNNDSTCRVIILQTGVGGLGHTLLGQEGVNRCSTMVFFENTFSLEKRLQTEDRIHRYGQDKGCLYIDLVTSPIDQKIAKSLQIKENIVNTVMKMTNENVSS